MEQRASEKSPSTSTPSLESPQQQLVAEVEPQSEEEQGKDSVTLNTSKQDQIDWPVFAPPTPEYSLLFDAIVQLAQQELIPEQCDSQQDQKIDPDVLHAQSVALQEFAVSLPPDYIVS